MRVSIKQQHYTLGVFGEWNATFADSSSLLTLPVDPERIEQLGATQLSAEQGYIQLH